MLTVAIGGWPLPFAGVAVTVAVGGVTVAVAVMRRLGGMSVGGTVRRVARRAVALLPVQFFVDSLLGQPEDLADAFVETLGLLISWNPVRLPD